jgi:putative flavoprotein involved in K+ transport
VERWESLTLFTPRRYSALPGVPFPGDPDGYPTRDEVIAYLERCAGTFELPVELDSDIEQLAKEIEAAGQTRVREEV